MRTIANQVRAYERFVLQAHYMADFEDTYNEKTVLFDMQNPVYDAMNDKQLHCYFSWRTHVRQKSVAYVYPSYVVLYAYELIHTIGAKDSMDAFAKLVFVWQEYRKFNTSLDERFVKYLKDYYICNEFTVSFVDLVTQCKLTELYPEIQAKNNKNITFSNVNTLSNYKFIESKFLINENIHILEKCFDVVMNNLHILCNSYEIDLNVLIKNKDKKEIAWKPFGNTIYETSCVQNKKVIISPLEYYECINGIWNCCKAFIDTPINAALIGYIIRLIESQLRIVCNYRYKLTANKEVLISLVNKKGEAEQDLTLVIQDEYFDRLIIELVCACYDALSHDKTSDIIHIRVPYTNSMAQFITQDICHVFNAMRKIVILQKNENNTALKTFKQAQLLADISDTFDFPFYYNGSFCGYDKMSNTQLRSYISWRTAFCAGKKIKATLSMILIYVNELINGVGVVDNSKGIAQLAQIVLFYRDSFPDIELIIPTLIKDFYICNHFDQSFRDIVRKNHLEEYYPHIFDMYDENINWYALFERISNYKTRGGPLYTVVPFMEDCCNAVLVQVLRYFKKRDVTWRSILIKSTSCDDQWLPFKNMWVHREIPYKNKVVVLNETESYECQSGVWRCIAYPSESELAPTIVACVLKCIEAKICEVIQYKRKLIPNVANYIKNIPNTNLCVKRLKTVLTDTLFIETIQNTVSEFYQHQHPDVFEKSTYMNIDETLLDSIRQKAIQNQEKLLVYTDNDKMTQNEIMPVLFDISTEYELARTCDIKLAESATGWDALSTTLSAVSKEFLRIVIYSNQVSEDLAIFAFKTNQMIEVLTESINEKTLLYIGDAVIECVDGVVRIYDEYYDVMCEIVKEQES